jgi:hypothetical protein
VLVAGTGRSSPTDLERVLERLAQSDAAVAGLVLTGSAVLGTTSSIWRASAGTSGLPTAARG